MPPTACIAFNNVDDASAIGALCAWAVRAALESGWEVSVVARDLDPALRPYVEWLPLRVPAVPHAGQWFSAPAMFRQAVRGRRWDVVHVQQPQLAPQANLLHLHYLVAEARERTPAAGGGARSRVRRTQARLTESGENWYLAHLPEALELMPVSAFLHSVYEQRFGPRDRITVLDSPAPPVVAISEAERATARRALVGDRPGTVVGYLGGADPRKGGALLLDGLSAVSGAVVLAGGAGLPDHPLAQNQHRVVPLGYVKDKRQFFAACDVFAATSWFDPGPLTALEAVAHGVPVIGTEGCGIVRDLVRSTAAVLVHAGSVAEGLRRAVTQKVPITKRAYDFIGRRSEQHQRRVLLDVYDRLRGEKRAVGPQSIRAVERT